MRSMLVERSPGKGLSFLAQSVVTQVTMLQGVRSIQNQRLHSQGQVHKLLVPLSLSQFFYHLIAWQMHFSNQILLYYCRGMSPEDHPQEQLHIQLAINSHCLFSHQIPYCHCLLLTRLIKFCRAISPRDHPQQQLHKLLAIISYSYSLLLFLVQC